MPKPLHFLQDSRYLQSVALAVAQHKQPVGHQLRGQPRLVEQSLSERRRAAADVLLSVRRIGDNQIEGLPIGGHLRHHGEGLLRTHFEILCGQSGRMEVLPDRGGVKL